MVQTAIEKLFFSIGLIDQVTGPSKAMNKEIIKMHKNFTTGFSNLALGGAGLFAVSKGLLAATSEARGFNKALNDTASLGVSAKNLDLLGAAAKKFTMRYGGDATRIVKAAYDVQSAIPGMAEGALAAFTYQGALLGKAGKSGPEAATEYMGTMFNIFENTANKIGQSKWVGQLTGQTAHAVKIFKTTTTGMSNAFKSLGAIGTQMKVDMSEQIAVLGTLQATMSAPEAGTAYKAMLGKYAQAQDKLNMTFKDASGAMLPTYAIIDKIEKKIGKMSDDKKIDVLNKAFGEVGAKAVMGMMGKTEKLRKSVEAIGKIKDSSGADKMADKMTDPLKRLQGIGQVLAITLGQTLLPAINLVLSVLSSVGTFIVWLMDAFPPLRWAIGIITGLVTTLVIAWGVLRIGMGIHGMWTALAQKVHIVTVALWKNKVITMNMTKTQKIAAISSWLWGKSMRGLSRAAKFLRLNLLWNKIAAGASAVAAGVAAGWNWFLATSFGGATAAVWALTVALLANPLVWIPLAIMAVIGAIVALVYWFDEITGFFLGMPDWVLLIMGPIGMVLLAFKYWDEIVKALGATFTWLGELFGSIWNGITGGLEAAFGWVLKILGLASKIPGLGFLDPGENTGNIGKVKQPVVPSVAAARKTDVSAGGIRSSNNNSTTNYGGVNIHTSAPIGPGEMEDFLGLMA